jgi:hypothetical protein
LAEYYVVDDGWRRSCKPSAFEASPLILFRGNDQRKARGNIVSTILIVILILVLIGAFPSWPYSRGWGYGPSGIVGVLLVILLILLLMGQI